MRADGGRREARGGPRLLRLEALRRVHLRTPPDVITAAAGATRQYSGTAHRANRS